MNQELDARSRRREERRLQQQDISRRALLDAAEEVFGHKGFHDTTLKEIAEQAGFAVGSVYSFFDGKDDLFRSIYLRRGDEFMAGMRSVLSAGGTALEQLHRLVDFQVGFFREHPRFARLTVRHANAATFDITGDEDPVIRAHRLEAMQMEAELFERGQRSGELRPGDPAALARVLSGIVFAYQSLDAASEEGAALPLDALHDVVIGAFAH